MKIVNGNRSAICKRVCKVSFKSFKSLLQIVLARFFFNKYPDIEQLPTLHKKVFKNNKHEIKRKKNNIIYRPESL